jgi:hypothetical protein
MNPSVFLVVVCLCSAACTAAETRSGIPAESDPRFHDTATPPSGTQAAVALHPADDAGRHPKLPFIIRGSCEGEDCTYGYKIVACRALSLAASDTGDRTPVGKIQAGDTVRVQTGNFHVVQPGIVVMKRDYAITDKMSEGQSLGPREDTLRFFARDTVYLLDRGELGGWTWWYRGKKQSENEFWSGPAQTAFGPGEEPAGVSLSLPQGEMWYLLSTSAGLEGWLKWEAGQSALVGGNVGCSTV